MHDFKHKNCITSIVMQTSLEVKYYNNYRFKKIEMN